MATFLRVPSLAENINEATLAEWLVEEGAALAPGDGVAEWITEKARFTYETETGGVLTARLAPGKSVLPVGAIMAVLDGDEDDHARARAENDDRIRRHAATLGLGGGEETSSTAAAPDAPRPPSPAGTIRATPAARRLAKELGLTLEQVAATCPPGTLLREEQVRAAADAGRGGA